MGRSFEETDPLAEAMRPPVDESPAERASREEAEAEAKKISDAIDAEIDKEKAAMKKRKKPVKVLLLGQSESGELCLRSCRRALTLGKASLRL
jgi:guanine nucleotide-binding protein alpha-1 subunit